MTIVFDMDNTLTDEKGTSKRPHIDLLLSKLVSEKHTLILWTNSPRTRALMILKENNLYSYFSKCIFREDYDPQNKGYHKDIRKIKGDIIIDDDPAEIRFNKDNKKRAILVPSYRGSRTKLPENEYKELYKEIKKKRFFLF